MRVRRFRDPAAFLERARDWLLRREAEHGLPLGLVAEIVKGAHRYDEPLYFATIEDSVDGAADEVVGCAFRTPPYKLGLTRMPATALPGLVDDVGAVYTELPAVMGPEQLAIEFGRLWSARTGCATRDGFRCRIHSLERVVPPGRPAPGRLRPVERAELPLVTRWSAAFNDDTGMHDADPVPLARWLVEQGAAYFWDDGGPRSMLAAVGGTERGVRLAYVYTPPEHRAHGYATAAVAELSRRLLAEGYGYCCLYTDLDNPTSNAIYARIGYRPVADVHDVQFE